MNKTPKVKIPQHLQPATRRWYRETAEKYVLESHHLRLLLIAGECWDRRWQAREILDRDGLTTTDKHGIVRPHPAVAIEKDARAQFMRALRELGLDLATEEPRPAITQPLGRKN